MVHQLKLQSVTNYNPDASPGNTGYKSYGITAQNQDTVSTLHLDNAHYVHRAANHGGDEVEASRTFDCKLYKVDKDTGINKEILKIKDLKVDGVVEYDAENHVFAAKIDENHSCIFEYNPENHDGNLNFAITGDALNLFV